MELKRIIWGCKYDALKVKMRDLEDVLSAMAQASDADFIFDADEKAVYLVVA